MTPSSKPEPELDPQLAEAGSGETVELTSPEATVDVAKPEADGDPVAVAPTTAKPADPVAASTETQAAAVPAAAAEGDTPAKADTQATADNEAEAAAIEDDEDYDDEYDEILDAEPSNGYPTLIPLLGSLLGLTAIAALMMVAFALPAIKSEPDRLPIGVSGTAEFQTQVRQALTQEGLTPFEITGYTEESRMRSAIEDREIYGGLSLGTSAVSMLVSSGGSPIAAQTLSSLANSLVEGGIPVSDVAPMPEADPRGEGLAATNLPLVIAAILPALILIPLYRRRTAAQLGITVGASVLIGLGLSAVLSFVLGSTEDSNFLLVSVGLAAGVLSTSLLLLGLFALAGRVGVGVGVALLVLFAAPLSGLSTAPEWLPSPWGDVGQLLPPGANATLLRSTAYFDGGGAGSALLVLGAWALIGLLLVGLGALRERQRAAQPPADREPPVQELFIEQPTTV